MQALPEVEEPHEAGPRDEDRGAGAARAVRKVDRRPVPRLGSDELEGEGARVRVGRQDEHRRRIGLSFEMGKERRGVGHRGGRDDEEEARGMAEKEGRGFRGAHREEDFGADARQARLERFGDRPPGGEDEEGPHRARERYGRGEERSRSLRRAAILRR